MNTARLKTHVVTMLAMVATWCSLESKAQKKMSDSPRPTVKKTVRMPSTETESQERIKKLEAEIKALKTAEQTSTVKTPQQVGIFTCLVRNGCTGKNYEGVGKSILEANQKAFRNCGPSHCCTFVGWKRIS